MATELQVNCSQIQIHIHTQIQTHTHTAGTCCGKRENSILITVTITNVICATVSYRVEAAGCLIDGFDAASKCSSASPPFPLFRIPCNPQLATSTTKRGRTGFPGSCWIVVKAIFVAFETFCRIYVYTYIFIFIYV